MGEEEASAATDFSRRQKFGETEAIAAGFMLAGWRTVCSAG